ncbi:MAG: SAM-dependent methyltransferase [Actinomycetota bacterium]
MKQRPAPSGEQSTPLLEVLATRIASGGPVTFAEYMHTVLYHAQHGYYSGNVPGDGAHYATSPSLTPWFGRLVGNEFKRMWEAMGRPDEFTVTEVGAGQADLAASALAGAGPMAQALRWRFVERFQDIQQLQRRRLGGFARRAEWVWPLAGLPPRVGCVLAHEVLDNFPVHLLEMGDASELHEVHIGLKGSRLVDLLFPLSDPALAKTADLAGAHMNPGDRCAVCLDVEQWCLDASAALDRGYILIVDYGDEEPDIWQQNSTGTIATFGPAGSGMDPLSLPGLVDITADVNFTALSRSLEWVGFSPVPVVNQGPWLLSLGLAQVCQELFRAAGRANDDGRHEHSISLMAERSRVLKLAAEGALGEALVLIAGKGAPVSWVDASSADQAGPQSGSSF